MIELWQYCNWTLIILFNITHSFFAQLAGAIEYTNCISAEGEDSPNESPEYDTKQSDGEASVMLELWGMFEYPFIAIAPGSSLAWSGSTW